MALSLSPTAIVAKVRVGQRSWPITLFYPLEIAERATSVLGKPGRWRIPAFVERAHARQRAGDVG